MWTDPFPNRGLINKLGLPDSYPGLVVLKPKKGIFRTCNVPFDAPQIDKFLGKLMTGQTNMLSYTGKLFLKDLSERGHGVDL
jgi:hypothetical protein